MKKFIKTLIVLSIILLGTLETQAQYGYGNGYNGRRGSSLPQTQTPPPEAPKPALHLINGDASKFRQLVG